MSDIVTLHYHTREQTVLIDFKTPLPINDSRELNYHLTGCEMLHEFSKDYKVATEEEFYPYIEEHNIASSPRLMCYGDRVMCALTDSNVLLVKFEEEGDDKHRYVGDDDVVDIICTRTHCYLITSECLMIVVDLSNLDMQDHDLLDQHPTQWMVNDDDRLLVVCKDGLCYVRLDTPAHDIAFHFDYIFGEDSPYVLDFHAIKAIRECMIDNEHDEFLRVLLPNVVKCSGFRDIKNSIVSKSARNLE